MGLSEAVLSEAVLSEAVLSEAVLSEAVLSEAATGDIVVLPGMRASGTPGPREIGSVSADAG